MFDVRRSPPPIRPVLRAFRRGRPFRLLRVNMATGERPRQGSEAAASPFSISAFQHFSIFPPARPHGLAPWGAKGCLAGVVHAPRLPREPRRSAGRPWVLSRSAGLLRVSAWRSVNLSSPHGARPWGPAALTARRRESGVLLGRRRRLPAVARRAKAGRRPAPLPDNGRAGEIVPEMR